MKSTRLLAAFFVGALLFATSSTIQAQGTSIFGSGGATGTTGTTGRGGLTTGTGTGGLGTSRGLGSTGGLGQSQLGQTQLGTQGGINGTGTGFIGGANNAGGFIGQQNAQQRTTATTRQFQGVNSNTGRNANRNFNSQAGNQGQNAIRPVVRIAFTRPTRVVARLNTTVTTRFSRLALRRPRFQGITVALAKGQQVVLRGTVASENVKSLAENIARMEPGVVSVRNEIVVKK